MRGVGHHEIRLLDLGRERLAHGAFVAGGEAEAALEERVVAEQVVLEGVDVDHAEGGGDAGVVEVAAHGLGGEGAGRGQGFGAGGQGEQHVVPAAVAGEAGDGGHGVLADGAGQAGVLERDEHVLDDAGGVEDDPPEVVLVDVVPRRDDAGGVGQQAEERGLA